MIGDKIINILYPKKKYKIPTHEEMTLYLQKQRQKERQIEMRKNAIRTFFNQFFCFKHNWIEPAAFIPHDMKWCNKCYKRLNI